MVLVFEEAMFTTFTWVTHFNNYGPEFTEDILHLQGYDPIL